MPGGQWRGAEPQEPACSRRTSCASGLGGGPLPLSGQEGWKVGRKVAFVGACWRGWVEAGAGCGGCGQEGAGGGAGWPRSISTARGGGAVLPASPSMRGRLPEAGCPARLRLRCELVGGEAPQERAWAPGCCRSPWVVAAAVDASAGHDADLTDCRAGTVVFRSGQSCVVVKWCQQTCLQLGDPV